MNPTLMLILQKNSADIEAIVAKIGVGTLISLVPYFLRIAATLQAPPTVLGNPPPGVQK